MQHSLRSLALLGAVLIAFGPALAHADGNVTVVNKGGSLVILGDSADNDVHVGPGGGPGEFEVEGFNGTSVNGAMLPLVVPDVTRNVHADLGDGSDTLIIEDVQVPNRLLVKLDGGDDNFDFTDGGIGRNVSVRGGSGLDSIAFSTLTIGGTLKVKSEGDTDQVTLDLVTVEGNARLTTGTGEDDVFIGDSELNGTLKILTNQEADSVDIQDTMLARKVRVSLGAEDDDVTVADSTAAEKTIFDGGAGTDTYTDAGGNTWPPGSPLLKKIEIVN